MKLKLGIFSSREVKKEIVNHLVASLIIFVFVELLWLIFGHFTWLKIVALVLGLILGTFLLDLDHLVYWFFLKPELEESRQAEEYWQKKDFQSLLSLLGEKHKTHTSLIFHHFFFQALFLVLTFFVLTSTSGAFGWGLVLAISAHFLTDIYLDLKRDPEHLKNWLFARSPFANFSLPTSWLWGYFWFYLVLLGGMIYAFVR